MLSAFVTGQPFCTSRGVGKSLYNRMPFLAYKRKSGGTHVNWRRLILGVLTALAMMVLTYLLPRGGAQRDASVVLFPMTVGVWAIFVLLFVKLK